MRLVLEGADRRRENLPTSDEITVIIPDENSDPNYRDIVLTERGKPTDRRATTVLTRPTPSTCLCTTCCFFRVETTAGTTSYGFAVTASAID